MEKIPSNDDGQAKPASPGAVGSGLLRRRLWVAAGAIMILLALFAEGFVMYLARYSGTPTLPGERPKVVSIGKGMSATGIAHALADAGIITNPRLFTLLSRIKGLQKKVKAGDYSLSAAMTPGEVLDLMVSGRAVLYRLTVPEGYTADEIAGLAAGLGLCSRSEFLNLCFDPELARGMGVEAESLEGYLYPDTYLFPRNAGARAVITAMVARFFKMFTMPMEKQAEKMGMTVAEVVTLGSIIEKEAGRNSELTLISSVFHNRLSKGMRLQSDPTVIYGIENFNGDLTRRNLTTPTRYNTYTNAGLPPGPIANPGKAALRAALFPAISNYLFFVARGDGTHKFSTTLSEHNRAVQNYQLRKGPQPGTRSEPQSNKEEIP